MVYLGEMLMSDLINEVSHYDKNGNYTVSKKTSRIVFTHDNLTLEIYDEENLLGFKLTGEVAGKNIYIVHDSDNYDRQNNKYRQIFDEARLDAIHIAHTFLEGRIRTKIVEKKGLFKTRKKILITIPDSRGNECTYDSMTVNTTNFYEGA